MRENAEDRSGHGGIHLEKMQEMSVSGSSTHNEAIGVLPVTILDGDNSSTSVPTGTGGPKSQ